MVSLDDVVLRLNSFAVEYATESPLSLGLRLRAAYVNDIMTHLLQIAGDFLGNMKLVGRPVGLMKNIGGGVRDFFYEVFTASACIIIIVSLSTNAIS